MSQKSPDYFTHTVLFWLSEPENTSHQSLMESALEELIKNCEFPTTGHAGKPAGTPREVVDGSYQYSLLFTFDSKESQDKYQVEPAHEVFIEKCKHIWNRVQVFDSVSI